MDVRVATCLLAHFFEHDAALRIIGRSTAGQHQLAIEVALYFAVSAYDADGVLQPVESGNLRQDRTSWIDPEARHDLFNKFRLQLAIFVRERIDGRRKQVLGYRELARKLRGRENR